MATLSQNGDEFERMFQPFLGDIFPNYERFWEKFVVPLRDQSSGGQIALKRGIDILLEQLCMAHYSVYCHFGFAQHYAVWNGAISLEAIFSHLGSAAEMVEEYLLAIARISDRIGANQKLVRPLTRKEYDEKLNKFWNAEAVAESESKEFSPANSSYSQQFEKFRSTGQPVQFRLHASNTVSGMLCKTISQSCHETYLAWSDSYRNVRYYRNALAHDPRLGMLVFRNVLMVPKPDKLARYANWSSIRDNYSVEDFVDIAKCITDNQSDLVSKTNDLWQYIMAYFETIVGTPEYRKMGLFDGDTTGGDSGDQSPEPPARPQSPPSNPAMPFSNLLQSSNVSYTSASSGIIPKDPMRDT